MIRIAPLAALLLALAFSAAAQSDPKIAALDAFLASGAAPRLADLLTRTGGRAAFAAVAPDDRAQREADWKACDALLAGGKHDPDGAAVRAALAKLPPPQLYFAGRVYAAEKGLHAELGDGHWGNAKENLGLCKDHLCYERAATLQSRTAALTQLPEFKRWDSRSVDSKPGTLGEHTASCYSYRPAGGSALPVVELVADAWDDAFLPAEAWFAVHDVPAHDALAAAGKDWCGPTLTALRKPDLDRRVAAEQDEDARMRKLKELGQSFSRITVGF